MDFVLMLDLVVVLWRVRMGRRPGARVGVLVRRMVKAELDGHMQTLTLGYTRAISEQSESRQLQVLETFAQTERAVAAQMRTLADSVQKESAQRARMGVLRICVPYIENFLPALTRDFRQLV